MARSSTCLSNIVLELLQCDACGAAFEKCPETNQNAATRLMLQFCHSFITALSLPPDLFLGPVQGADFDSQLLKLLDSLLKDPLFIP